MEWILIIATISIVLLIYWWKDRNAKPWDETLRPYAGDKPTGKKWNDKLVVIKGGDKRTLQKVIQGFCNSYNHDEYAALPHVIQVKDNEFNITFPYNVELDILYYFVNYLQYPLEVKWQVEVNAWATAPDTDNELPQAIRNAKLMLYIPANDTSYDVVYLTTETGTGYKFDFGAGKGYQALTTVQKAYTAPPYSATELSNKPGENFE